MRASRVESIPFGNTGHHSSRVLFGAAALFSMRQDRADRLLETLFEAGINHIDTAADYGDSELRIAPWMKRHRQGFFLATKTGARTRDAARQAAVAPSQQELEDDIARFSMEPLFEPGQDDI